ncbi:MAG: chorismate mutase [Anaerolineales bacterium]|nr:chorismate mutase [Anaerolineales bacterium]
MSVRGVRGATVAAADQPEAIASATQELLLAILQANPSLQPADLASVLFTVTEDLNAAYPAEAARQLGWTQVPLLCGREIPVPGSLLRCIRVLLHWNTGCLQAEVQHVYLREAARLRPDWNGSQLPDHLGGVS